MALRMLVKADVVRSFTLLPTKTAERTFRNQHAIFKTCISSVGIEMVSLCAMLSMASGNYSDVGFLQL